MTRHPMSRTTSRILSGVLGLTLVVTPATPSRAQPTVEQPGSSSIHVVKRGESLWIIARRHFGRASQWPRLYRLNRNLIGANPSLIRPGMRLRLAEPLAVKPESATSRPVATVPVMIPTPSPSPTAYPANPEPEVPSDEPRLVLELPSPVAEAPRNLGYLPVATSLVVPGSGQMLQGNWEKGLTHLGVMSVSLLAFKTGAEQGDRPMQLLGGLGLLGITLWSPWDAYQSRPAVEPSKPVRFE